MVKTIGISDLVTTNSFIKKYPEMIFVICLWCIIREAFIYKKCNKCYTPVRLYYNTLDKTRIETWQMQMILLMFLISNKNFNSVQRPSP